MNRNVVIGGLVAVVFAAVALGVINQVRGGSATVQNGTVLTEQATFEFPNFSETPSPARYESLEVLAARLEERGLECSNLTFSDLREAGHETVSEFATCDLLGEPALNVGLWLYERRSDRDEWLQVFEGQTYVVYGPNWIATPEDEQRAEAIQGALGGELVPAETEET